MNEPNPEWISAWASILGAIAAIGGLAYTGQQLRALVRQTKREAFAAFLALESEIIDKKQRVDEAVRDLGRLRNDDRTEDELEVERVYLKSCMENWFNIIDRFASCLRRKIFREKLYKDDYCKYISAVVGSHPEHFQDGSIYDNIVFICKKWKIEIPKI